MIFVFLVRHNLQSYPQSLVDIDNTSTFGLVFQTLRQVSPRQFTGVLQGIASESPTFYEPFWWCVWILHPQVQWRRYHVTVWHYRALVSRQPIFVLFCFSLHQTCASTSLVTQCRVLRLFVSSSVSLWLCISIRLHQIFLFLHPHSSIINLFFPMHQSDVCVVLVTSLFFIGMGNDSSFGMCSLTLGSTWWR